MAALNWEPAGFLRTIREEKAQIVRAAQSRQPLAGLQAQAAVLPPARDLAGALARSGDPVVKVLAEVKRASPVKGPLRPGAAAGELARAYAAGGAAAISVLTDQKYFGGRLADLTAVKAAVNLPVLRKDFLISSYQVWEARAYGADGCLLIAGLLGPAELTVMCLTALAAGVQPLIEVHGDAELPWALRTIAQGRQGYPAWRPILGFNARDLVRLKVRPEQVRDLAAALPPDVAPGLVKVAASGIKSAADAARLAAAGFDAVLVGEALVTAPDPAKAVRCLRGE
ncbi:MAG: indole-3-glycerol phosphate synthase TrpC [Heliobacteriaceae bacterium]|nr:indole-3-glycerol phosphate synthase TrpC [Heliobacteriaceae bacterium]MDD4587371.1 indole-3-glycerol phosphate synthase TrpC [Heliobacteriaceae bacterium]